MQKLCCVHTRQQFSASLDYFVTSSPPYLHQFSTVSGGICISEYTVPLSLGNLSLNNKETGRQELWKNHRGMWFDHVEHMEEGTEQNKQWENFWWTVDEDMFTYVMKTKIEELIDEITEVDNLQGVSHPLEVMVRQW